MARRGKTEGRMVSLSREQRAEPNLAEHRLSHHLRNRRLSGLKFRRQYSVGGFIADFACPAAGLIVEVDGSQHARRRAKDSARTRELNTLGFFVLQFWSNDVLNKTENVLQEILKTIAEISSGADKRVENPSPGAAATARSRVQPRKRGEAG